MRDPQHDRAAVAGQRQRRRVVSRPGRPSRPDIRSASVLAGLVNNSRAALLRSASASSSSASAARSTRRPGSTTCSVGQPGGQIAGQAEVVGHPHPRRQHHRASRGGVAQRALVGGDDDDPRTAPNSGGRRGRPARGRRDRRPPRPVRPARRSTAAPRRRRRSARPPSRPALRRAIEPAALGVASARHPDHRAGRLVARNRSSTPSSRAAAVARTCAPAIEAARSNPSRSAASRPSTSSRSIVGVRWRSCGTSRCCEAISAATCPTIVVDFFGGARLDVQPQQRLGVGRPQVEPGAVAQIDGHPVEVVDGVDAVAERLQHRVHARARASATVKLISPDAS